MVAKINRGEAIYGAVVYNQQKVNEGTARIISGNRMIADVTDNPERIMQRTLLAFENYLTANKNTDKPILHISLNPTTAINSPTPGLPHWQKTTWSAWATGINPTLSTCMKI